MALTSWNELPSYEIQSLVGTGGMGEVYRGRDTRLDRQVAIKVLPASLSSDVSMKQRLERRLRGVRNSERIASFDSSVPHGGSHCRIFTTDK